MAVSCHVESFWILLSIVDYWPFLLFGGSAGLSIGYMQMEVDLGARLDPSTEMIGQSSLLYRGVFT